MHNPGKRRNGLPYRTWKIVVPEEDDLRFNQIYTSTATHKLVYGLKSQIITQLLRAHLDAVEAGIVTRASLPQAEEGASA